KRAAHVSDQAVIGHRHRHDLVVNSSQLRASYHPVLIERWIEKADVVGDGSGQQLIFLHYRAHLLAESSGSNHRKRNAIDQDLSTGRFQQSEHDLDQRRLARPRRTHNGQELPRLDDETDIFKHKRFGFGVAKIHVAKLNSPLDLPRVGRDLVMSPFERAECYVSQALEMQFYDTKIERLF